MRYPKDKRLPLLLLAEIGVNYALPRAMSRSARLRIYLGG
jgi:hypothetical protein